MRLLDIHVPSGGGVLASGQLRAGRLASSGLAAHGVGGGACK